jgi:predicted acyl esterase
MRIQIKHFLLVTILLVFAGSAFSQIKRPANFNKYDFQKLPSTYQNGLMAPYVVSQDFKIILRDGAEMDAAKFYPSEPNPYLPDGYPCVIMVHGYGDRKETLAHFASAQAAYGYVVYTYSVRGQGNSTGLSNLMSTLEADDLIELVNYIKADTVGLDSTKILIMGGSQGGTVPYIAALRGMNVAAIISSVTSPEFATSWNENGSVKMSYLWTISYTPDSARYNPLVTAMEKWVYETGKKNDKWDSIAYWMPIGRDFNNQVQNLNVPILLENSWQDYFFNASGNIRSLAKLQGKPHRVYFGAVMGHGGDISETENQWHMNFFNEWFYEYLWRIPQGFNTRPKYHFAYSSFPKIGVMWSFLHDSTDVFPPAGSSVTKLYFNSNSRLTSTNNTNNTARVTFANNVAANYTLLQAIWDEFKGTNFTNKFKIASKLFTSTALTQDLKMVGIPKIQLRYMSSAALPQYNFQIFEVTPDGKQYFVSRLNYTDRAYTTNQIKTATFEGQSRAHIFKAGNKIRIVATNLDRTPEDTVFLNTNPYVLPVMVKATNTIYFKNSYIDLPFVTNSANPLMFSSEETESIVPDVFSLNQNYPNPFNPATTISFNLPSGFNGLVTLKIFDITGREVSNLVNQNLTQGIYNFQWNASRFSSGVYFYQLTAGSEFREIKKMVLVK